MNLLSPELQIEITKFLDVSSFFAFYDISRQMKTIMNIHETYIVHSFLCLRMYSIYEYPNTISICKENKCWSFPIQIIQCKGWFHILKSFKHLCEL